MNLISTIFFKNHQVIKFHLIFFLELVQTWILLQMQQITSIKLSYNRYCISVLELQSSQGPIPHETNVI